LTRTPVKAQPRNAPPPITITRRQLHPLLLQRSNRAHNSQPLRLVRSWTGPRPSYRSAFTQPGEKPPAHRRDPARFTPQQEADTSAIQQSIVSILSFHRKYRRPSPRPILGNTPSTPRPRPLPAYFGVMFAHRQIPVRQQNLKTPLLSRSIIVLVRPQFLDSARLRPDSPSSPRSSS